MAFAPLHRPAIGCLSRRISYSQAQQYLRMVVAPVPFFSWVRNCPKELDQRPYIAGSPNSLADLQFYPGPFQQGFLLGCDPGDDCLFLLINFIYRIQGSEFFPFDPRCLEDPPDER